MPADQPTRRANRAPEGGGERARVDLLLRRTDAGPHGRMEGRLQLPAPAPAEPLDSEAEPALELVEALEGLELVPVEGDEQGARGARLQGAPGCGGQVPEKGGGGRGAGQVQAEEGVLVEGWLGA